MSGGGDDKQTVPAFMPGMDNMLAQQLSAGGYGAAPDLLAYMNAIHTPMQIPTTTMPPVSTGKDTKNKTSNGGSGRSYTLEQIKGMLR